MNKRRAILTAAGILSLCLLTAAQLIMPPPVEAVVSSIQPSPVNEHLQFAMLVFGIGALVYGLGGPPPLSTNWRGFIRRHGPIMAITLLALLVRLWRIEDSMRVLVDEVNSLSPLISLWVYQNVPLLTHMNTTIIPYSWLYAYLQNGFVALLGNDLLGLRMIAIVGGALNVPALYALALTLTDDRRTAHLSALALAGLPLAIHYSRLGIHSTLDPVAGTLALLWLARAYKHNTPFDWALGGAALGLTHAFWEGGRLFNTGLVLLLLGWLAVTDTAAVRGRWRGILRTLATCLAVTVPLYLTWHVTGTDVESRFADSGVNTAFLAELLTSTASDTALQAYLRGLADAFLVLFAIPESSLFYGGAWPFLLPFVSPFALIGLLWSLRSRRPLAVLPVFWVVAVPAANGLLLTNTAASPRYLNVIPVLALLVGYGAAWVARRTPRPRLAAYGLAATLVVGQVGYYYGAHMPRFNQDIRRELADLDDATFRAAALPLDALAVIVPTTYRNPQHADWLMRYLYSNDPYPSVAVMVSETFINEMTAPRVLGGKPPGGYAFFIEQNDTQAQAALTNRFGPLPYEMSPYPVPEKTQFRMYRVR